MAVMFVYLAVCLHLEGGKKRLACRASWRWRRKYNYLVLLYQDGGSHRKRLQLNTWGGGGANIKNNKMLYHKFENK